MSILSLFVVLYCCRQVTCKLGKTDFHYNTQAACCLRNWADSDCQDTLVRDCWSKSMHFLLTIPWCARMTAGLGPQSTWVPLPVLSSMSIELFNFMVTALLVFASCNHSDSYRRPWTLPARSSMYFVPMRMEIKDSLIIRLMIRQACKS